MADQSTSALYRYYIYIYMFIYIYRYRYIDIYQLRKSQAFHIGPTSLNPSTEISPQCYDRWFTSDYPSVPESETNIGL